MGKCFGGQLFFVCLILAVQGCTTRTWYESMQSAAQQSCRNQPPPEQARCDARLNKDDFDTYQKKRSKL